MPRRFISATTSLPKSLKPLCSQILSLSPVFESANWLRAHGENRVISLARKHLWTTYQIDPIDSEEFNYNVRFLALYKRYENEVDTEFIKQFRKFEDPLFTTIHNRSDKLFEKRFLNNSFALHTIEILSRILYFKQKI